MNVEALIEFFRQRLDSGELDAEFIRYHRLRFAKGKLNADFRLRRRDTAFPQEPSRMGNGMLTQFAATPEQGPRWMRFCAIQSGDAVQLLQLGATEMTIQLDLTDAHVGLLTGAIQEERLARSITASASHGAAYRPIRSTDKPTPAAAKFTQLEDRWNPVLAKVYAERPIVTPGRGDRLLRPKRFPSTSHHRRHHLFRRSWVRSYGTRSLSMGLRLTAGHNSHCIRTVAITSLAALTIQAPGITMTRWRGGF